MLQLAVKTVISTLVLAASVWSQCPDNTVRLSGGESTYGRVEICMNGTWGTICDEFWQNEDASVVCQQLGFSPNASTVEFSNCTHGAIRLAGVVKSVSGRVEICIHGVWGVVCDDGWDTQDANVACGQLGYFPFGATPRYGAFYGESSQPLLISDLSCSGTEAKLLSCRRNIYGVIHCRSYEEAGVTCLGSFPVTLSMRVGSLLGGDCVAVSGMTFHEDDQIICMFGKTAIEGLYINEDKAVCVSPPARVESIVEFKIEIMRGDLKLSGGALYQYISPESVTDYVELNTKENTVWSVGEVANFSWNPSSLIIDESMTENVKVDISMWVYNNITEEFEETSILATNLPNSGSASLLLPDSPSSILPHVDKTLLISFARVGVNTSTTEFVRSKRSSFSLRNILGKLAKFGKIGLLSYIKLQVASRLLCEAFALLTPPFPTRSIPPCPCNENDALDDNDRFTPDESPAFVRRYFHPKSKSCFRQANVRDFGPGQQCCYGDDGNINTGNNGGTADLVAPTNWKTKPVHFLVDVVPWFLCCSFLPGLFKACNRYTSRRPVDDCSDWPERPPPARMFGDPHIVTLDGYQYTFNGKGEFILVETLDEAFILQGRMTEPPEFFNGSSAGGTSFTALAMKQNGNPTVQLEVANDMLVVLVDGEELDFAGLMEQRIQNVTVVKEGNEKITTRFTPGITIQSSNRNGILTNIVVTLPDHLSTKGLLGQFNGDPADDLLPQNNSTPLPANSTTDNIYYMFGLTWIVSDPRRSLFTYGADGDWDFYYNVNYIPAFEPVFSSPELEQQANEICGNNELCIFDIAATGDVGIGSNTMESVEEQERLKEQFIPRTCSPPCVHGACVSNNTCSCSEGFNGSYCEIEVSEDCESNLCENDASCKVLAGDYICECLPEYTGPFCEMKVEISSTTNNFPVAVAVGAIVGSSVGGAMIVVLCIIVIVVMAICIKSKQRSKSQDEYELELKKVPDEKPEDKNIYVEN